MMHKNKNVAFVSLSGTIDYVIATYWVAYTNPLLMKEASFEKVGEKMRNDAKKNIKITYLVHPIGVKKKIYILFTKLKLF